jgi:hypothetical protein
MAKEQEQIEQVNTAAALAQQPEETAQTAPVETVEVPLNQLYTHAELVEVLAAAEGLQNEVEVRRELGLEMDW